MKRFLSTKKAGHVAILLLALVLASCASINRSAYPSTWPEPIWQHNGCQELSGWFYNRAEMKTYAHPQSEGLLGLTLLPPVARLQEVRSLKLLVESSGSLRVSAYNDDRALVLERIYEADTGFFRCHGSTLILYPEKMPETRHAPDTPVVGFNSHVLGLKRASDGALILREVSSVTGLAFLIVPVRAESEQWYLFRPYPPGP